jgi:UDP-N-acetyl-D-mannosaminuronate dehydrogenase
MINIGLLNELAVMCDRMGIYVWEIIDAAATKPFGFMPFYPDPGRGGHCSPMRIADPSVGVAYKGDIDDVRESPALDLCIC